MQRLVESLPRRVQLIIIAKREQLSIDAHSFGKGPSALRCPHNFSHAMDVTINSLLVL